MVGYADDLLLLAPSRSAMELMLKICEEYAGENNLEFSTDPDPVKSKSKCIFMQGQMKHPKPLNLKLYGMDLPWVKSANHLGNELSEACNMDQDMKNKRADFINKSTEVREGFNFAQPNQILQAVRTYCCSMYGAMTWSLFSDKAMQVFNCWGTCVKLAWGVPRATHTYLVDNLLAAGIPSVRLSLLACFLKGVRSSSSLEVRLVANLASADTRSSTGSNLSGISRMIKLDSRYKSWVEAKSLILQAKSRVPDQDCWRLGCLRKYLGERYQLQAKLEDTSDIDSLIDSICSS